MDNSSRYKLIPNLNLEVAIGNTITFTIEWVDGKEKLIFSPGLKPKPRSKSAKSAVRKTRKASVSLQFAHTAIIKSVVLDTLTAQVIVKGRSSIIELADENLIPSEASIIHYYSRPGKKKILCAYFCTDRIPPLNINNILSQYDVCFAIDTNTKQIDSIGDVSIAAIVNSEFKNISSNAIASNTYNNYAQIYINATKPTENYAWFRLIQYLSNHHRVSKSSKIAIIVDSDYDNLKDYNFRTKPYFDDHYLPPEFELIYATDASGSQEYFPNQLIRRCNSISNQVFKKASFTSEMNNQIVEFRYSQNP